MEKQYFLHLTDEEREHMIRLASAVKEEPRTFAPLAHLPFNGSFTRCYHHLDALEDVAARAGKILGAPAYVYGYWCNTCKWIIQGIVLEATPYEALVLNTTHKYVENALAAECFGNRQPVAHDLLINRIWEQLLGKLLAGQDVDLSGGEWCQGARQANRETPTYPPMDTTTRAQRQRGA